MEGFALKIGRNQPSSMELEKTSYLLSNLLTKLQCIGGQEKVISFNGEMRNQLASEEDTKKEGLEYFCRMTSTEAVVPKAHLSIMKSCQALRTLSALILKYGE